jgi:hypothetical protein
MKRIILGLAVVSTFLMMICAICTMVNSHPVVISVMAVAGLIVLAVNEKPFREGHDFIDKYVEKHIEVK